MARAGDGLPSKLEERMKRCIESYFASRDPAAVVTIRPRQRGLVEVAVISALFEVMDSEERERLTWEAYEHLDRSDMVHIAYTLMLTPGEAHQSYPDGI